MAAAIGNFIDRIQLGTDDTHQIAIGSSAYGICDTAANMATKTVSIPGFTLNTGTTIHVKFTYANTASSPTLNVSSTGAVSMILYDSIVADTVLTLTYDGTSWIQDYNSNDKVQMSNSTTTKWIKVLLHPYENSSATTNYTTTTTNTVLFSRYLSFQPSTGTLYASIFKGGDAALTKLNGETINSVAVNTIFSGPASGSDAAVPTFRALVAADIPNLSWNKITSDTPTTLSGYGITDVEISEGVITIGSATITPITSVNGHTGSSVTITATDLGLTNIMTYVGDISSLPTATSSDAFNNYNNGDVVTVNYKEYVYIKGNNAASSSWVELGDEGSYKLKQTAFTNSTGTADGNNTSTSFIYSISQNEEGVVSDITTRTLPIASTSTAGIIAIGTAATDALAGNTVVTNVSFTNTTSSDLEYPVLFKNSSGTTTTAAGTRFISATNKSVTINGSTGILTAQGGFKGNLDGNATTVNSTAGTSTLAWDTEVTLYTVGGAEIKAKMPTYPDSVAKLTTSNLGSAIKPIYLVGGVATECNTYAGGTAVTLNGSSKAATTVSFFAPTSTGTQYQILVSGGGTNKAPVWTNAALLKSETSTTANTTKYTTLTLGNSGNVSTINEHSEGIIVLYSAATAAHTIQGESTTTDYTHVFPKADGWIVTGGTATGTAAGVATDGITLMYLADTGILTTSTETIGSTTQSIYLDNGQLTALTYTANRLYYSADIDSFEATGHYATDVGLSLNKNSLTSGYTFEVNGKTLLDDELNITGDLIPTTTNAYSLGDNTINSEKRWKSLFLGTANSYGSYTQPVYWNNGVPATVTMIQKIYFSISNGKKSVTITSSTANTLSSDSIVTQIVVTDGEDYLRAPLTWISGSNYVAINTATATAGLVEGYILIVRGAEVSTTNFTYTQGDNVVSST